MQLYGCAISKFIRAFPFWRILMMEIVSPHDVTFPAFREETLFLPFHPVPPQPLHKLLRQRRGERHPLPRPWVRKCQRVRVEHQAGNFRALGGPVNRVAADRMPDGLHVHADLVRPPGQNVDVQQRHVPPARKHRPVRNRRAAFGVNCHFLAVFLAPRDGLVDAPAVLAQIPFNQRAVMLLHLPLLQLAAEGELALVVLCHEQQTAGVLVQPVDDAGAQFLSN